MMMTIEEANNKRLEQSDPEYGLKRHWTPGKILYCAYFGQFPSGTPVLCSQIWDVESDKEHLEWELTAKKILKYARLLVAKAK